MKDEDENDGDENDGDENDEDDEIGGRGVKREENIWFLFFFKTSNFRLGEWNFLPFSK